MLSLTGVFIWTIIILIIGLFLGWICGSSIEQQKIKNELNCNYENAMSKLEFIIKQNKKRYGLIEHIFNSYPNAEIIGLDKNKNDEELIIVKHDNTIYLFGQRYQGSTKLPKLFFEIRTKENDILEEKYIYITDVLMVDNNIGNGTVAMNALIKYAKKINAKYIVGWLSSVDNDHAERRNHYYEKFGFTINDSQIRLELCDNTTNNWWSYDDMEEIKKNFLDGKTPKEIAIERNEDELAITTYLITENLLPVNAVLG